MGGFKGAWQRKWQQEQIYKSWVTSRVEHNAVWMATLNTSRTVLTTKDNKKDDSYIVKLLLTIQISAAGGMQKGTNGDESDCARTSKNSYR